MRGIPCHSVFSVSVKITKQSYLAAKRSRSLMRRYPKKRLSFCCGGYIKMNAERDV